MSVSRSVVCAYTEDIYSKTETFESRTVVVKIMDTSESVSCNVDLLRRFIMTSVDQLQCNLRSYALTDRQVIVAGCECGVVVFSVASVCVSVCLSVCLSVVLRLLEILTYKVHFFARKYVIRISRSCLYCQVHRSRSRSHEQKGVFVRSVFGSQFGTP